MYLYCECCGCIYIESTVDVFILRALWMYLYCEYCGCIYFVSAVDVFIL